VHTLLKLQQRSQVIHLPGYTLLLVLVYDALLERDEENDLLVDSILSIKEDKRQ